MVPKLYFLLLGCRPAGRLTEQHDIFFGIASSLKDLIPEIKTFWPGAKGKIHIDVWREINVVDDYRIQVVERSSIEEPAENGRLFFINLGGYRAGEFEEYHYKMLCIAKDKGEAIKSAKATFFYRHAGFPGADSHIDDKYGVDVDDIFQIEDILPENIKRHYRLHIRKCTSDEEINHDAFHIGYLKLENI